MIRFPRPRLAAALAAACALSAAPALAQSPDFTVFLNVRSDPSPYVADWEADPSIVTLVLSYTGAGNVAFYLDGRMTRGSETIVAGRSTPFEFVRPSQVVLTTRDGIWETNSVTYQATLRDQLEQTGRLPDGEYQFCVDVRQGLPEAGPGALLAAECAPFSITAPQPPTLITPADGESVIQPFPTFVWTPVLLGPNTRVGYHLRLAPVLPGQSPLEAINNLPTFESDLAAAVMSYPQDALPLDQGGRYVWQVQAIDDAGQPVGERQGKSEIWSFTVGAGPGEPAFGGRMPDTLTLIAGVARLRGLRGVDGSESPTAYTLNGTVALDLLGPVTAQATVTLRDLAIEKASLLELVEGGNDGVPPTFISGRLDGRLDTLAAPGGDPGPVRLREVEYTTEAGLAFGGELVLGDRPTVPLTGRARLIDGMISGTLTAEAPAGTQLFSVGGDPVRLDVRRVEATYPTGDLRLNARLAFFGSDAGCEDLTMTSGAAGAASATIQCTPLGAVPLVAGVEHLTITATAVTGALEADLAAGRLGSYELSVAGEVRLSRGGTDAGCGATFDLTAVDGAVAADGESFRSRCDAGREGLELDWLGVRVANLRLERLAYGPGSGFDVLLRLDLEPQVRAVAGFTLPAIAGVTVGTDGFTIPAVEIDRPGPRFDVLGFGLRVMRYRLPAFTLGWNDWEAGSSSGFRFGLDAELTLPDFAPGASSCRATQPLPLGVVELADGRLSATVPERSLAPACALAFAPDLRLEVDRVGGAFTVRFTPNVVLEASPELEASLVLPPLFACTDSAARRLPLGGARLRAQAGGRITGTVTGLAPTCPMDLAAARVTVTRATLVLGDDGGVQTASLEGDADAVLTLAAEPSRGSGSATIDLINRRLAGGRLDFPGPFRLDLPREAPVLAFELTQASFDTAGLHVSGRNRLLLPDSQAIGMTIDALTLEPERLGITAGRVIFDAPFAVEIGFDAGGALRWRAVAQGAALGVPTGVRVDLPRDLALGPSGFTSSGDGAARLVYGGRELDGLSVAFTRDFAVGLDPTGVRSGQADFRQGGERVAFLNQAGFQPDLDFFGTALIPARLGLPTAALAFVSLRDDGGRLLVRAENTAAGIRVYTPPGDTVSLVVPAVQRDGAPPPSLPATFDVTLDPTAGSLSGGNIEVAIPPDQQADFGVAAGVPDAVRFSRLAYSSTDGLTLGAELQLPGAPGARFTGRAQVTAMGFFGTLLAEAAPGAALVALGGDPIGLRVTRASLELPRGNLDLAVSLDVFRQDPACESAVGRLAGDSLSVSFSCAPTRPIALVPDIDRVRLTLLDLNGSAVADLGAGQLLAYRFDASGAIRLDAPIATADPAGSGTAPEPAECGATFRLTVADGGASVDPASVQARCDAAQGGAELGWLRLRLSNLALERLEYRPGDGFDFAFRVDVEPSVPVLPQVVLPALRSVLVARDGLTLPQVDAPLTAGRVDIGGFGVRVTRARLSGFTLSWNDWQARSPNGFRFGLEGDLTLPQTAATPSCLDTEPIVLSLAELTAGRVAFGLAERRYSPACPLTLASDVAFDVERLGGALAFRFAPALELEQTPEIEGALVLPGFFACPDPAARRVTVAGTALRLGADGRISGTVDGLAPSCPLDLAALQVTVSEASLAFSAGADRQSVTLTGAAAGSFAVAGNPVRGTGSIAVDLLAGRMLSGSLTFPGPFRFDLPRDRPVLSFLIDEARFDTAGLHIAGRQRLVLADGQALNTTFENVVINPRELALTAGAVRFDTPFAFEVAIGDDGALGWKAVPRGAAPGVTTGLRVNLPTQIALTPSGFQSSGDGDARLLFRERDLDSLRARFSENFAVALQPFGVSRGQVDFLLGGEVIGLIDRQGFRPNFAYFADALVPARFGLPTTEVAYLQLRDESGTLLVRSENTGAGIRLSTPPGAAVALVLPALQLGRAEAPRVNVSFDIVLDPLGRRVQSGTVRAAVPAGQRAAFDLSSAGLPVRLDTLAYEPGPDQGYRFTLGGGLVLFGDSAVGGGSVILSLDATGRLAGRISAELAGRVPLVAGGELAVTLRRADGEFDAALLSGGLRHDLDLTGAVELTAGGERRSANATLHLSEQGLSVTRIEAQGGEAPAFLDAGIVRLGVANIRVPRLAYAYQTGEWDFELLLDLHLAFPALDSLVLPPVEDVALRPDGFHVPAYAVPELPADTFSLAGFVVRPLAFRTAPFTVNWFTGETPDDPGFAFDLELGFPADAPASLRDTRLSVLDAGYRRGGFTGSIEPRDLPTAIGLPLGDNGLALDIQRFGGSLSQDSAAGQVVSVTTGGTLVLPEYMRCDEAPAGTLPLPGAVITLSSDGRVTGAASEVLPRCPARIGPLTFQVASSNLRFDVGAEGRQQAELYARASVRFPAPSAGDTVVASGDLGLDLVSGRVTRGSVEVNSPFRWNVPWSGEQTQGVPLFTFVVNRARIDQQGLHLTGSGQAEFYDWDLVDVGSLGQAGAIADGSAEVTFEDLTLGLPAFSVTAGSVGFTRSIAFDAGFEQNKPRWRSSEPSRPRKPGPGVRITLPPDVSLSREGLRLGGTAVAELTWGDSAFAELQVAFADDFLFGYDPVGVTRGRATFRLQNTEIAYVDPAGFWPGDIFGVLPIPARVGLPTESVAYLELRDQAGQLLVESRAGAEGLSLRTRNGRPVRLVIPALAGDSADTARIDVQFDVVVNPASYALVSGSIRALAPEGGAPLFSLSDLGLPLDVREVAYEPAESGYALRLDARLSLPASLGGLDVIFNDLLVQETGIAGTAEVGRYTEQFDSAQAPVASRDLAENVVLDLLGARVTFGDGAGVRLSGVIRTPLFSPPQGGPVAIFFSGGVDPSGGLALAADPLSLPDGRLPIGLITFEPRAVGNEPAIGVRATGQEFAVRLSGILRAPGLSDGFAATIEGLEVGTRGVVLPAVSLTEPEERQRFDLFGATFTLKDGDDGQPAIALGYTAGVLAVTMSGEVEFMGRSAAFSGLRVASDGGVSMASATLLRESIVLADSLLTLDSLAVRDNRLHADLGVTLPAPLGQGGVQRVRFSIGPDGSVEGGGTLVLRDEAPGLGGERTQFGMGLVTLHPRYVDVTLDPGAVDQSAVRVVADLYLQNGQDNRVQLGDVAGGVVSPGLRVGFDGAVAWGSVALAREFAFDFEAVRLTVTQLSSAAEGGRFAVALSGRLALNLAAVSGSLDFADFRIDDRGQLAFSPSGVRGGELSIAGVVNLQVQGFAYSNTPTTITIAGGSMPSASSPAAAGAESVDVSSYIRFGGRIDVVDVLAGGVEEFLVYRTAADGRTGMVVRQASLGVYDVLDMRADLRYRETPGGFEMVLGASGKLLQQYDVMLVGAIEQGAGTNRMGLFLASGVTIPIPGAPIVVISQLGGGFFYNPKPEYLELVRQYAQVSQTAGEAIRAPAGEFAVLLYGAARITPAGVAEGRVLVTVTPTALQVDGAMTILNQGNRLRGDAHLVMGLKKAYAEGNIAFTVAYDPVLEGAGTMQFYVFSPEVWGVTGATEVSVVDYFEGTSQLYIGPPGFIVSTAIAGDFSVWFLKVRSDFDLTAWYHRAAGEWGAHAAIKVKGDILDGAISAKGTLQSALIFPGGSPMVFAAGKIEGCVVGQCASKRVWLKFRNGRLDDYDTGRNSELEELLDDADDVAEEILAAQDEAQAAAEQAQMAALAISYDELAAAYQRIQGWSQQQFEWVAEQSTGIEAQYAPQPGEGAQFAWYLDLLRQVGAPSDTALIRGYADSVTEKLRQTAERRADVNRRIGEISADFLPLEPVVEAPLPGTPVSQLSFAAPVTRIEIGALGDTVKILESGPGFAVDPQAATAARTALDEWRVAAEREDQETRARLEEMETTLRQMRAVTTAADDASLLSYARLHADALSAAERQYAAQADHILRKQDWMRASLAAQGEPTLQLDLLAAAIQPSGDRTTNVTAAGGLNQTTTSVTDLAALVNRYTAMRSIIVNKTRALRAESFQRLRALIIFREALLDLWLGTSGARVAAFLDAEGGKDPSDPFYDEWADSTGMWIWYHLARAGMQQANNEADAALAGLVTMGNERLGALRSRHGDISASLDRLYQGQAALTGVLHDAYDQYLLWRTEVGGDSTAAVGPDLAPFAARRDELAQELTVPQLTGVQVTAVNQGYRATQTFAWSGSHPRGAYEFLFRDVAQADATLGAPLYSNGPAGTFTGYRFLPQRGWTEPARSVEVGVRGGAGFVGLGRADYGVAFQEQGGGTGASLTYVTLTDATPPSRPVVVFPGSPARPSADGGSEAWTSQGSELTARWTAGDPESGIAEYRYAVGVSPGDSSIRPWQSAGGRAEIRLEVNVSPSTPMYVSVQARNGQNLWGEVGTSPGLRWDPSPPAFPAGAAIAAGPLTDGAVTPLRTVALPACPVPEPAFPASTITVSTRDATSLGTWDGTFSKTASDGSTDGGQTATAGSAPRREPQRSFSWPAADDPESGLLGYYWRVDTVPAAGFTPTGWTALGTQPSMTLTGDPLDYERAVYLSLAAVGYTGVATAPLVFGPFRVPDPTRPSNPAFCAGLGGATDRLTLTVSGEAGDPETGVRGYQYRVRTDASTVRDWPADSTDWSSLRAGGTVTTGPVALTDGQRYYVDVRAVNGHGLSSDTVTSGPVYVDATPPPTPAATAPVRADQLTVLPLRIVGAADPESGFMTQHFAVGTGQRAADVIAWRNVPGARPGEYSVDIPLSGALTAGATYWLQIRTVNMAGVPSATYSASFTVPVPTIPTLRTGR